MPKDYKTFGNYKRVFREGLSIAEQRDRYLSESLRNVLDSCSETKWLSKNDLGCTNAALKSLCKQGFLKSKLCDKTYELGYIKIHRV